MQWPIDAHDLGRHGNRDNHSDPPANMEAGRRARQRDTDCVVEQHHPDRRNGMVLQSDRR